MKKSYLKRFATTVSLAATLVACPTAASAATDMFLKLGDIKGESLDDKHKDEIDVLAWSWGEADSTSPARKGRKVKPCPSGSFSAIRFSISSSVPFNFKLSFSQR